MICVTSDVHHATAGLRSQTGLDVPELELAVRYTRIAHEHGIKVTHFITGAAIREERADVERLLDMEGETEIGGHGWSANRPRALYGLFRRTGRSCGPFAFQRWEVRRTLREARSLGVAVSSWRGHGFREDANTHRILADEGIDFVSNDVDRSERPTRLLPERRPEGIVDVPINVWPDHDYVRLNYLHAAGADDGARLSLGEWEEKVRFQVEDIVARDGVACLLLHPINMYRFDRFETFERLCRFLSGFPSCLMRDLGPEAPE